MPTLRNRSDPLETGLSNYILFFLWNRLAWMKFGGNGLNMGLGRNFFSDGKGNHRISGIRSIPSKTSLIDSSSFALEKRLAWAEIGGEEHKMG